MHYTLRQQPEVCPRHHCRSRSCFGRFRLRAQQQQPATTPATPPAESGTPASTQAQTPSTSASNTSTGQPGKTPSTTTGFSACCRTTPRRKRTPVRPAHGERQIQTDADSMFDPVTFPFIGLVALIGQAQNTEPSYGQGLKGYGANATAPLMGTPLFGTTMTTSMFPSLLHQDPRYFQLGRGSILHRSLYSVSRIFVTRNDSGSHGFNYSEIVGNAVAAGISNAYHPAGRAHDFEYDERMGHGYHVGRGFQRGEGILAGYSPPSPQG